MKSLHAFLIAPCLFLGTGHLLAQNVTDVEYAPVGWKLGDARTVDQVATVKVTRNDSVLLATEVKSRYRLKVIAVRDTVFEVEFQDITLNDQVKIESDAGDMSSMEQMLGKLIADIQSKIRGFKYVLLVDRETAQAFAVKNEGAMAVFMEEMVVVVLNAFFDEAKVELGVKERKALELQLHQYVAEQMPAAMQTVANCFNYIFQSYTVPYLPGRTHTTDIEMYYIDAIKYGDKESRASQTATATQTTDRLTLGVVFNEDQHAAYQLYVIDEGQEAQVPFSQFNATQRFNTVFDRRTTWITRNEATVEVKMGGMFTVDKTVSVFKP